MVPSKLESAPVAIFFLCLPGTKYVKTSPKKKFVEFFFCRGFLPAVLPAVFASPRTLPDLRIANVQPKRGVSKERLMRARANARARARPSLAWPGLAWPRLGQARAGGPAWPG